VSQALKSLRKAFQSKFSHRVYEKGPLYAGLFCATALQWADYPRSEVAQPSFQYLESQAMIIRSTVFGASLLIAAGSVFAHGDSDIAAGDGSGYLKSGDNVITTGLDGCLRSGTWADDNAIGACEGDAAEAPAEEEVEEVAKAEEPAKPVGSVESITLTGNSQFETNSADLTPAGVEAMNTLLGKLAEYKNIKSMTVTGHTDSRGSESYNQALSERRAQTVADFLAATYPDANIDVIGLGESSPIDSNDTEAGRLMNRRVEVTIDATKMVFN